MSVRSPAARRFYRAFYNWTLSSSQRSGSRSCVHISRRTKSTTATTFPEIVPGTETHTAEGLSGDAKRGPAPSSVHPVLAEPQRLEKTVEVHSALRGVVLGRARRTLKAVRQLSGLRYATEILPPTSQPGPLSTNCRILLQGNKDEIETAVGMISQLIELAKQHRRRLGIPDDVFGQETLPEPENVAQRIEIALSVSKEQKEETWLMLQNKGGNEVRRISWQTRCIIRNVQDTTYGAFDVIGPAQGVRDAVRELGEVAESEITMIEGAVDGTQGDADAAREIGEVAASDITEIQGVVDDTQRDADAAPPNKVASQHETFEQDAEALEDFRRALRTLTHPVVLITAVAAHASRPTMKEWRGVTVSSFTAVTLTPQPVISFNLKTPSRTWDAINETQSIRIHIMAATPDAAGIVHTFTLPHERPEAPFEIIQQVYGARFNWDANTQIPRIIQPGAVLASMDARIMPAKCVTVGDHVVILAEVLRTDISRMRLHPEHGDAQNVTIGVIKAELEKTAALSYSRKEYRGEAEGLKVPDLPKVPLTKSRTVEGSDATAVLKTTKSKSTDIAEIFGTSPVPPSQSDTEDLGEEFYKAFAETVTAERPFSFKKIPHGLVQRRSYSSSARRAPAVDVEQCVTSPHLLQQTVDEFLGFPPVRSGEIMRMYAPMHARAAAARASATLQESLEDGTLTPQKSLDLEREISRHERKAAKKLAVQAAHDLRRMLDSGKVDYRRAGFLEMKVEQGMAVVVEEAKLVRGMFDRGEIGEEDWERAKEKLMLVHGALNTEAIRLRGMVDEEDEGFVVQDESAKGGFDGFEGNR